MQIPAFDRQFRAERLRGRRAAPLAVALLASGLFALTGCAGAKVTNLAAAPVQSPAPSGLIVDVLVAPDLAGEPVARSAAGELRNRLIKRYAKAGLAVLAGPASPRSAARLRVVIGRAKAGSWLQRFAIGFGAGRSVLHADTALQLPDTTGPVLRFASRADSGWQPGFILPAGVAAATGKTSNLAISGGLGVASNLRSGLMRDADRTAKLIVEQTRRHYLQAGWRWPET